MYSQSTLANKYFVNFRPNPFDGLLFREEWYKTELPTMMTPFWCPLILCDPDLHSVPGIAQQASQVPDGRDRVWLHVVTVIHRLADDL